MAMMSLRLSAGARPDEVFATHRREPSAPAFERSRGACNLLLCAWTNYMICKRVKGRPDERVCKP